MPLEDKLSRMDEATAAEAEADDDDEEEEEAEEDDDDDDDEKLESGRENMDVDRGN